MAVFTGVRGCISSAHYSKEGTLHGHTWSVTVWFATSEASPPDAVALAARVRNYLKQWDHTLLPDELAWGERLASRFGVDLGACRVVVSREQEGIFAEWTEQQEPKT